MDNIDIVRTHWLHPGALDRICAGSVFRVRALGWQTHPYHQNRDCDRDSLSTMIVANGFANLACRFHSMASCAGGVSIASAIARGS